MKELSIEEKARRYDEAIERTKEYAIDGYLDAIAVNDIFPELRESEDERVRKALIDFFSEPGRKEYILNGFTVDDILAWLEKQDEHANFRNKIQIGDKVTRNEDGVLVNLSQLNRIAKKDEKQGEQKPAWSEEDKERYISCLQRLGTGNPKQPETINSKWFKEHVYPQSTWKPSDEQIKAIDTAVSQVWTKQDSEKLMSLYKDLKKLRGE